MVRSESCWLRGGGGGGAWVLVSVVIRLRSPSLRTVLGPGSLSTLGPHPDAEE